MKSFSLQGSKREQLSKSANNRLRAAGFIPCELYGAQGNIHFQVFKGDIKNLVYTPDTFKVDLEVDGKNYEAIVKELQFHPLSDEITHIDFHVLPSDKPIKVDLPIRYIGTAEGVRAGGKLVKKMRSLRVKGLAGNLPDAIEVDITNVGLGKSLKVAEVQAGNYEITNAPNLPLATVEVPRGMRGKTEEAAAPTGKKK